jgi:hypothetical protein
MPPREIRELQIPWDLYLKLAGKGIAVEEVRQVVANARRVHKGPKNRPGQVGRCYFVEDRTDAGRLLKVLLRRFNNGLARLITAWDPNS